MNAPPQVGLQCGVGFFFFSERFLLFTQLSSWASLKHKEEGPAGVCTVSQQPSRGLEPTILLASLPWLEPLDHAASFCSWYFLLVCGLSGK